MEDDENNENGDLDVIDESAEYTPKSEFSKPALLFETAQKCGVLRAKEMKKGYYNTTFNKEGLPIKSWIEDSRKAYCSSVTTLKVFLLPEILEDGKFKSMDEDFETLFENYAYCKIKKIQGNKYIKDETDFYMPEVDIAVRVIKEYPDGKQFVEEVPGFWNSQINEYWNEMVKLSDILLERLMRVIHRKNYFESRLDG